MALPSLVFPINASGQWVSGTFWIRGCSGGPCTPWQQTGSSVIWNQAPNEGPHRADPPKGTVAGNESLVWGFGGHLSSQACLGARMEH